ncbi:HPP family protein [candidate division KSB1 bacterium]
MESLTVKDIMLPLEEYVTVDKEATLYEAMQKLDESYKALPEGAFHHRAVLVADKNGNIVGKVGHSAFLKALEPKYKKIANFDNLAGTGVNSDVVQSMMEEFRLWDDDLSSICRRTETIKIKEVMHPFDENIDENAPVMEAVHKLVSWNSLSLLVTREGKAVGILRLSDLYYRLTRYIKQVCHKQ